MMGFDIFIKEWLYCCFLARAIGQLLLCGRLWWLVAFPFQPRWEINCRCRQSLVGGADQLPPLQCSTWAAAKQFLVWVWICYPGWLGWWCQSGFLRPLENWQPRMLASWEHPTSCRCTPNFRCGWRDGATASRPSKPASNWVSHSNWTLINWKKSFNRSSSCLDLTAFTIFRNCNHCIFLNCFRFEHRAHEQLAGTRELFHHPDAEGIHIDPFLHR